jgi:hypothetical protein
MEHSIVFWAAPWLWPVQSSDTDPRSGLDRTASAATERSPEPPTCAGNRPTSQELPLMEDLNPCPYLVKTTNGLPEWSVANSRPYQAQ